MAPGDSDLALAGLVHDLNNVFQTVRDAADLLDGDPRWASLAAALRRSAERGGRIAGEFSGGRQSSADLECIVNAATEFARDYLSAVHAPPVQFVRRIEPGLFPAGVPAGWERVLANLFINAAQAMETGGAVEISARRAGGSVEITVTDNGPGIAPDLLPRIFEPHFSTKAAPGLGLHIVKSLITRFGGTVTAANRPNDSGAEFRIGAPAR